MNYFKLKDVSLEFPVYGANSRSLKKMIMRAGAGKLFGKPGGDLAYVRALNDITLTIKDGDRIGLIGPNGAGKSTLLRVLSEVYEPTSGLIERVGHVTPLLDINLGINYDLTGYENILLRGQFLGFSKKQIKSVVEDIIEFSELGDYVYMPMRVYSDGMKLRLTFSVSTAFVTEILLMDESILAGDARFLEKAQKRIEEFINQSSIFVIASHSEEIIKKFCNKAILLCSGEIQAVGEVEDVLNNYKQLQQELATA